MNLPAAKFPKSSDWRELPSLLANGVTIHVFQSGPIRVTSSVQIAEMPDGNGTGPQWLVSVSHHGKRPKPHHVSRALRAFGMTGAEEDNHHSGNARHFFLVCDPSRRVACECKSTETVIVERDGYRWSNPKDGPCRGCEGAPLTGRPCPIHTAMTGTSKGASR
jgi:hypothetical protein